MAVERSRADEQRDRALAAERAAALTLQHSLLPALPSQVGRLRVASRYRTGDPDVQVGGDWCDAFAVRDGVLVVVGDVQGHDLEAAALMGQLRTVARTRGDDGHSPAGILAGLARYLGHVETERLATVLVVLIEPTGRRVTVASAGHLPPMLLIPRPDGGWQVGSVDVEPGPPLGVGEHWPERRSDVPAGGVLLLYTDGLVESRGWSLDVGVMMLGDALVGLPTTVSLDELLNTALDLVPRGSRGDDVAALAVGLPPATPG